MLCGVLVFGVLLLLPPPYPHTCPYFGRPCFWQGLAGLAGVAGWVGG